MKWLLRLWDDVIAYCHPWKCLGYAFTDHIAGEEVYYYEDYKGRVWMKNSRWGWFKCRTEKQPQAFYAVCEALPVYLEGRINK